MANAEQQRYREAEQKLWREAGATPTEHYVRLPWRDVRVRIQEVGDGPPVLFLHGGPNSGSTWAFLAARLQKFRCLLVDRPGTGLSEALSLDRDGLNTFVQHFVAEVLDGLGIERAHLLVSSFGGYIALRAAMATPERIGRTVQMGAPPAIPGGTLPLFMRLMAIPGFPRLISALPPSEKQSVSMLRQIGHGNSIDAGVIPPVLFAWYLALMRHTGTMRNEVQLISSGVTLRGWDPWFALGPESLARVSNPTYFLWGENDTFGSEAVARNLVAQMPDAKLRMIPGAGHLPWLDNPASIAKEAMAFLES